MKVWTDGAAEPTNPGPAGWGWWAEDGSSSSGSFRWATNNQAELAAAIDAARRLAPATAHGDLTIVSDSRYVVDCITKRWHLKWEKNGWMTSKGTPVLNAKMWVKLIGLAATHDITFEWCKGHAGIEGNERADALAVAAAMRVA